MGRPLVIVEGLAKAFAGRTLFAEASFRVESGERVALVGPNGCGKSTLLHIVAGRATADHGSARLAPRTPLAFFAQHHDGKPGETIADVVAASVEAPAELVAEAAALEARMADPKLWESGEGDAVATRFGEVQREMARAKALAASAATDSALFAELGFTESDLPRETATLSGGERTRLHLARVLARSDPTGVLVLDEPTNHLDVETIEWLEERLQTWEGAILVVAHDRAFLDEVATRVLAFERGTVESYDGNYSAFTRARDEDEARLARQREREAREAARQKAVIEQFRHQKRFDGQMASRLGRLAKYRAAIDRTPDPLVQKVQFAVGFPETFKSSNEVLRARGLGKKYGEKLLFYGLDLDLAKGDRVGLVGANGAGKTTLLRILTGRERRDLGTIEVAPGAKGAFYAQGHESLDPKGVLREEILSVRPGVADEDVRALLGRFGFRHDGDLLRKVSSLSGGERSRLALLKTILTPSNLLILDEPTNHLDLESRQALVGALNAYQGTLLVVSHDRWFLDSVVDKVAVLARRSLKVFVGDFTEARTAAAMEAFAVEKPVTYHVRKGFKDFETGARHAVGTTLALTPSDLAAKRLYRTALSMGWMAAEE
ncbi:MAG TPA: ABC-F family ATP-binding cassette domain-containing protein [Candidatus Thermoplasmatota archaeon]|nr:ABC-F family ATP-binding cassette domain-containing protein [Candidatus Thermoplasmatota archaeon]